VNRLPLLLLLISISGISCNAFKVPDFITFSNLRTESVGVGETTIAMDLVYYNTNKIGFQVRRTEADVYVDDVYLGRAISDTLIRVAKKSEFIIPVKIKTDMKNLLKNAWSAFANRSVQVRATGTISAGVGGIFKTIPLAYEGRHEISFFEPKP
jgi:LEA14-like dessication related protein